MLDNEFHNITLTCDTRLASFPCSPLFHTASNEKLGGAPGTRLTPDPFFLREQGGARERGQHWTPSSHTSWVGPGNEANAGPLLLTRVGWDLGTRLTPDPFFSHEQGVAWEHQTQCICILTLPLATAMYSYLATAIYSYPILSDGNVFVVVALHDKVPCVGEQFVHNAMRTGVMV